MGRPRNIVVNVLLVVLISFCGSQIVKQSFSSESTHRKVFISQDDQARYIPGLNRDAKIFKK